MCGIVGSIAERQIEQILVEGLKRLEYRGYDSAGIAILNTQTGEIQRERVHGKVTALENALINAPLSGHIGIAHTRWATHGKPNEQNAHPHVSQNEIAIVHNGIIENHQALRKKLIAQDYIFESETDTEVIAHLLHHHIMTENEMMKALQKTAREMQGAFAICVLSKKNPNQLFAIRCGSPLVIGVGMGENFIASDPLALLPVTQKFIYLEEGDIASISRTTIDIHDANGDPVTRETHQSSAEIDAVYKGDFRHFMLKEIYDQPKTFSDILQPHFTFDHTLKNLFNDDQTKILSHIQRVYIVACGTSFHAGLVARYWLESIAKIPAQVEVASEFRYRESVMEPNTLFIAISQSGETADTLAAVRHAKQLGCQAILAICNTPESSLFRESNLHIMIHSGKEIGVAATKTFTAQLTALAMLTLAISEQQGAAESSITQYIRALQSLPALSNELLRLDPAIQSIAKLFTHKKHALFIARGALTPIAAEGALKLKEISYVHAESYAAGELKHGPLALIDEAMPVIVLAPHNHLFEKIASNIHEVQARGGEVFIFSDQSNHAFGNVAANILMPAVPDFIAPIAYSIPMQLLAYHIAVLKGTDVDQPRNLAKSVTVE